MHLMLLLLHCTSVHLCNPVRYLHITEFLQIEAHVKLEAQWVWHMKAHLKTQYEGKSATCTWCCCYTVHCAVCNPLKHGWQGFLKVEAHMELEAHRASFVETIWGQVRPRHIHLTLLYFECAFCATPFRHIHNVQWTMNNGRRYISHTFSSLRQTPKRQVCSCPMHLMLLHIWYCNLSSVVIYCTAHAHHCYTAKFLMAW